MTRKPIDYTPRDDAERLLNDVYHEEFTALDKQIGELEGKQDKAWERYKTCIRKHRKAVQS